ncbi:MAG: flagellar protein FliS [Pseudohongiellaceae bacterium]|jgi:flagellar protein FliS
MALNKALNQYKQVNAHEAMSGASPHRLIQLLMDGALQRMAEGKGALQRNDMNHKGLALGKAISILGGLSDSLNLDVDSDIPANLASLYEYMVHCLMLGNSSNDVAKIEESIRLLRTIKLAWDEIIPALEVSPAV